MRALNALSLCFITCSTALIAANNEEVSSYLSKTQAKEFSLGYEKNEQKSSALRDSWIRPLQLRYSISRSNSYDNISNSQNAAIVMDQVLFQSGGIYYGIKYANALHHFNDLSTDLQKQKLIKEVVSLLIQIHTLDLKIKKQHLSIANAKIEVKQKRELFLAGELTSSFLDNAILKSIAQESLLYDLQNSQSKLIAKFESFSDLEYKTLKVPNIALLSKEQYLAQNIELKQIQSEIDAKAYNTNVTRAKYLPKISFFASYNWDKKDSLSFSSGSVFPGSETNYYNYGLKITMPIDYNSLRDVEAMKIEKLQASTKIQNSQKELETLYKAVLFNLDNLDKKIALAKKSQELYSKLYSETNTLYTTGYKTEFDLKLIENSLVMQKLEVQILELNKSLEKLNLYEKVKI